MKKIFALTLLCAFAHLFLGAQSAGHVSPPQERMVDIESIRSLLPQTENEYRAITTNLVLDYDQAERDYANANGFDYDGFSWIINSNYVESDDFTLDWIIARFDVLYDNATGNVLPISPSTVTIDSVTALVSYVNDSATTDTIRVRMLEVNAFGQITPNVLWEDLLIIDTSLTATNEDFIPYTVYPSLQLAQGQVFAAEYTLLGDTAGSEFLMIASYRNECGTTCGANPAFIQNTAGFENTIHFGNWGTFSGINTIFADCNGNQQNDTPNGDCEEWYIQNLVCQAFVTVETELSGTIDLSSASGCEGEFIMIDLEVFGAQGTPTITWTGAPGNSGSLSSMTVEDPVATVGVTDDVWTAMIIDQNNDTSFVDAMINSNQIVINPITDASISCGALGNLAAIVGGETAGVTYAWSNGGTNFSALGLLPGNYSVTVSNDFGCEDIDNGDVYYTNVATNNLDFITEPVTVCEGREIVFPNNSDRTTGWNWEWDYLGDGSALGFSETGNHTYSNTGTYSVILSADSAGCPFQVIKEITVQDDVVCISIDDPEQFGQITIAPNPAHSYVNIIIGKSIESGTASLQSIDRKQVLQQGLEQGTGAVTRIDVSDFARGIYILHIQDGSHHTAQRISIK